MPKLTKILIKPALQCFHRCRHCEPRQNYYRDLVNKNDASQMPLEMAERFIKEAYFLGMEECLISGGDPLLYPHLRELVKYAGSFEGVSVYINSSGHNLTEQYAYDLLTAGLNSMHISLDSPYAEKHNHLRGIDNAWENSVNTIDILTGMKRSNPSFSKFIVQLNTVITRHNYMDIPELVDLALRKRVDSIYLMNVYGDIGNLFLLSTQQIEEFRNRIIPEVLKVLNKSGTGNLVVENAEEVLHSFFSKEYNTIENYAEGIYWSEAEAAKRACNIPDYWALLEPDGSILPCCMMEISEGKIAGNFKSKSLADIWTGDAYEAFRRDKLEYCKACPIVYNKTLGLVPEMCKQMKY
ncbi:MAG: radical SAM protein [Clostridia bacterium]|nr:radical SAM protein [Clostridia bacterium]